MRIQRVAIAITAINLVLLVLTATQGGRAAAQAVVPLLRTHSLEVVDDHDQVRARLNMKGAAIELDLFDQNGIIRAKFGADQGSGLLLADEASQPGVRLIARKTGTAEQPATTGITIWDTDGKARVITARCLSKRCNRP